MPGERVGHEPQQIVQVGVGIVEVGGEVDGCGGPAAGGDHVPADDALENGGVAHHSAVGVDPEARQRRIPARESRVEQRMGFVRRGELRVGCGRRILRARGRGHGLFFRAARVPKGEVACERVLI